jgi:hypothetical protein
MENNIELPENKPAISGKYKTTDSIKSAIYKVLKQDNIEGRYSDENWIGVQRLNIVLTNNGLEIHLLHANYEGHGQAHGSNLPTRKVYRYSVNVRDKDGKNVELFLKVTCAFVGKTGTMADHEYELTYYFF